jgi:hypothetical protein
MMDDQKILDNAPVGEGIDLVDITGEYFDEHCNHLDSRGLWSPHNIGPVSPRSLADVKELVELRNANATLELTCKSRANSINEMSNMIAELQKANTELEKERDSMLHEVAKQYDGDGLSEWAIGANHVFMLFAKWVSSKRSKALKVGK